MNNTLLLLDGNALMHRAYHGIGKGHFIPTYDGKPVGMVYGFASTVINAWHHFQPKQMVITFDSKEKTFRHEIDDQYKAHRSKAPDDFYDQIDLLYEFVESTGLPVWKFPGYESDDLIGSLATYADNQELFEKVYILSGDLDFLQLVNDRVKLAKFAGKIENAVHYGTEETVARYEITPKQMIDFKAIIGDSSDNYKGIPGVGPKTAAQLLNDHNTLDGIYKNLDSLKEQVRDKFIENKESAYHCQYLAAIKIDIPLGVDITQSVDINEESMISFLERVNFPSLARRLQNPHLATKQTKKEKPKAEDQQASLF